jgi:WXG100 family type VII secretion target
MTQPELTVDGQIVVHGASKVRTTRQDVSGDLSKLRNVIDDLVARGWHGMASRSFNEVMQSWDESSKKLLLSMDEIASLLDKTNERFAVTEAEGQQLVQKTKDYSGALGQRLPGSGA